MSIRDILEQIEKLSGDALFQWYNDRFDQLDIDGDDLKSVAAYIRKLEAAVKHYADGSNWVQSRYSAGLVDTYSADDHGFGVARDALQEGE